MGVRTKRWCDPQDAADGYRLLVCRYRPRGVKKEEEAWDGWCQALAPSVELHADAYGKAGRTAIEWSEYERRYSEEMKRQRFWIDSLARRVRSGETLTLLCSSACTDPERCHRMLLARLIERAAHPEAPTKEEPARVVRRISR